MTTSSLYPPIAQSLRDEVIGKVIQRCQSHRTSSGVRHLNPGPRPRLTPSGPEDTDGIGQNAKSCHDSSYVSLMTEGKPQQMSKMSRKRLHSSTTSVGADVSNGTAPLPSKKNRTQHLLSDHDKYRDLIIELVSKRDLRREKCRVNQARYRKRQDKFLADLELGNQQTRAEIQKLENQRQRILFATPTNETVWNIATEYFRLFRHGFAAPAPYSGLTSNEAEAVIPRQSHKQLEFLQAAMSIDVADGTLRGVDALLESWRLFSLYHKGIHLELERIEKDGACSVVATTKTSLTITENTIRNVYPHLSVNEFGDFELSPLACRLINQRIEMNGTVRFSWDRSSGRVVTLESKADMLTPMLRLLGSLEDVAHAFNDARITLEGKMR
ncbi:hypothetical protein L916_21235 [Phytophthora nicotianae]|uniref:BZIP domain-containing protein n=1 Tax=Phytophthora nicotianae TaxID=4792 RepID=W2HSI8_PHYNI|nr:hypothetical protein L916_21235 [Phytophthora nicotianae]